MSEFGFKATTISTGDVGDKTTTTTVTKTNTVKWQSAAQVGLSPEEWQQIEDTMAQLVEAHEKGDKARMVDAISDSAGKLGKKAIGAVVSYFTGL